MMECIDRVHSHFHELLTDARRIRLPDGRSREIEFPQKLPRRIGRLILVPTEEETAEFRTGKKRDGAGIVPDDVSEPVRRDRPSTSAVHQPV